MVATAGGDTTSDVETGRDQHCGDESMAGGGSESWTQRAPKENQRLARLLQEPQEQVNGCGGGREHMIGTAGGHATWKIARARRAETSQWQRLGGRERKLDTAGATPKQ